MNCSKEAKGNIQAMYQHKKKGFTLAEVLITLLIIGVVSSLVIPALINDTKNAELIALGKNDFLLFLIL